MSELKPCPFCGGEAELRDDGYEVHCAEGCTASVHDDYREEAIAAWNRRATPTPPDYAAIVETDCAYVADYGAESGARCQYPAKAQAQITALLARVATLEEALEWYADEEQWSDADSFYGNGGPDNRCDYGKRARTALGRTA